MSDPHPPPPHDAEQTERAADAPAWARYGLAVVAVAAAMLLTFALRGALGQSQVRFVFIFFFPAVLLTAIRAGVGPAVLATALSAAVGNYFFLPPLYALSLTFEGLSQTALFLFVAAMLVYLTRRSRRAEAEARRSEESLSITLRSIGDAVIATDAAGRVTFMNAVAERLTGWTAAEARALPLREVFRIFSEETREEAESPVEKVLRTGGTVGLANHTVLVARDGRETPIDDSAAPIKDRHGRTAGVVLVFHDITERRQAEAARERLAAIVESSEDAIIGKSLDGTVTSWNAAAERLYGYAAGEMLGRPISVLVPPDRAEELAGILESVRAGRRLAHLETVRVRKDGTRVPVSISISPVADAEGHLVGASTIARDISERRRGEEERAGLAQMVESERRRLRNLVGSVPGVVWEAWGEPDESSQRIDFVSDHVEQLLGYSREEWLSEPNFWLKLVHPEDRARAAAEARAIFESRQGGTSEFRWVAKGGRVVHVEAQSVVILDGAGRPVGMRGVTMDITASKLSAEALRESERRLAGVVDSAMDAIITVDADQRVLLFNRAAEEMFRCSAADAAGQPIERLLPSRFRAAHAGHVEEFGRTGVTSRAMAGSRAVSGLRADGEEFPLEASISQIVAGGQKLFTVIMRDITERVRAEEEREQLLQREQSARASAEASEQHYRALADAMPQIVWTARADGYNDYYNRRWYEYTGLAPEQSGGWSWQHVIHPDDVEASVRAWAKAVAAGEDYQVEYRFRRAADGEYRWHLGRAEPLRDASGRVLKWFGTATDIHEQKVAEERVTFLAEASRLLPSSLDYGTTLAQLAGLAVAAMADYSLVDIVGEDGRVRRLAAAHSDPERQPLVERLRQYPPDLRKPFGVSVVLRTGRPSVVRDASEEFLKSFALDDDHLDALRAIGVRSFLTVPLVARGRTFGALTFASTAAPRDYAEDDIAFAEELARRAALAVDNALLYGRAQEANRAKDEFLATLSHELRTPLTPIIGWTHMMRSGRLEQPDAEQGLRVIDKNSQALSRLINDLLDMSSILSGKMRIDRAPVALNDVLREAAETVRPQADARRVALEVSNGGLAPVTVSGDRTRLVQVFWNLLNNAVKFSREGGRVRVSCGREGDAARVEVADEGDGISPSFLPHVFERFRQADMGTTREHGGLGIGLALVKSFVEAHGGTVTAASGGEGRGSRFVVSLPALASAAPAGTSGELRPVDAELCEPPACRVLLVEDAGDTLDMLKVVFEARGYETETCATPEEALRVAGSGRFDIIVSDIGLPRMDGYELIKRLRRLPHLGETPAVALTGYAAPRDAEAALDAGFDTHIAKPVDPAALAEQVELLLKRRAQRDGDNRGSQ
jgi:PAS domain S-box-containing protein